MDAIEKPRVAADYPPDCIKIIHQTCIEVATRLGDYIDDMRIIGGTVPSLIVDQSSNEYQFDKHIGTLDLDIGFSVAVLEERTYEKITTRLKAAGYKPDTNEEGNPTAQRWVSERGIKLDFLIPPTLETDKGGKPKHLEKDFAPIIMPALNLAFIDFETHLLSGAMPSGKGVAEREIKVCGPAAFIVLKAKAFANRGLPKDAYDLHYVLKHHSIGVEEIAKKLVSLRDAPEVDEAIEILERDFSKQELTGPTKVVEFLGSAIEGYEADVAGLVRSLITTVKEIS